MLKKILWAFIGISLAFASTAYAVQISVPSATGNGYYLQSNSNGSYTPTLILNTVFPTGLTQDGNRIFLASTTAGNTIAGYLAGTAFSTSTNVFGDISGNTAFGYRALQISTSSVEQTAFGAEALANFIGTDQTPTSAGNNTAVGFKALYKTTTGFSNTAVGDDAMALNTTGDHNTGIGVYALFSNTAGTGDTGLGENTLQTNTTGSENTAVGGQSMFFNTTGAQNTAVGRYSLVNLINGGSNVAIGYQAMKNNYTGSSSIAVGRDALFNNTSPTTTVSIGFASGFGASGYNNQGGVYVGYAAGNSVQTGSDWNTLIGNRSGQGITTGNENTFIGASNISASQNQVTTGAQNISIGYNTAVPSATANGQLDIGNFIYGTGLTGTGSTLSSGLIGFGTTTPAKQLSVQGDSLVSGTLTAGSVIATSTITGAGLSTCNGTSNALTWNAGTFGCNSITTSGAASTTLLTDTNAWGGLQTFTNSLLAVGSTTINGNATTTGYANFMGNVAIGTSTPTQGFEVLRTNILLKNTPTGFGVYIVNNKVGIGSGATPSNDATVNSTFSVGGNFRTVVAPSNSGIVQNLFGVGTSSPFARLSIQANPTDTANINLFAIGSSTASATTTLFSVDNTGAASTTKLFGAGLATCNSGNVLTWANGQFGCAADQTAAGAANPFSWLTNFGVISAATTSPIWAQNGLYASSTSQLAYASTTAVSATAFCLTTSCITSWPTGSSSFGFPWTAQTWGNSTSTTLGFLNGFLATASSTIVGNATTTGTFYAGIASSTSLYGAGLATCNSATSALTWAAGSFGCNTITGGSGAFSWTPSTNFALNVNATTTPLWMQSGLMASSTSYFPGGVWTSGGNVGIGTTTPLDPLTVIGTLSSVSPLVGGTDTRIYFTSNAGSRGELNATNAAGTISKNLALDPYGGNVGVGTTTPGSLFSVQGDGLFSGTLTAGNLLATSTLTVNGNITSSGQYDKFGSGACGPGTLNGFGDGLEVCGSRNSDTSAVQIQTSNTSSGTNAWNGFTMSNNLGDNTQTHFFGLYLNSSNYNSTTFGTSIGKPNLGLIQNTDGPLQIYASTSTVNGYLGFFTGGTDNSNERMRITNTGNIGIGTTSPASLFSVGGIVNLFSNATSTWYSPQQFWGGFSSGIASSTTQAATITIDWKNANGNANHGGSEFDLILTQNTTLIVNATSSNPIDGGNYLIHVCQDNVGSRTLTVATPNNIVYADGFSSFAISSAANTGTQFLLRYKDRLKRYELMATSTYSDTRDCLP